MKVGIVGAGAVGTSCMFALALRGSAREIVLVNRNRARAEGAVADLQYGTVLTSAVALTAGDYADLRGAAMVVDRSPVSGSRRNPSRSGMDVPCTGPSRSGEWQIERMPVVSRIGAVAGSSRPAGCDTAGMFM